MTAHSEHQRDERDHAPVRGDAQGVVVDGRRHPWDASTDVVVVGLGAAGGAAAIDARRHGAEVIVVDRFAGGGATGRSAGAIYFGGGTDLQREHGWHDTPENMFAYLRLETGDAVPEATLRAFCERSVTDFEWLRALGVPFPRSGAVTKGALPPDDCTLYFSGNELAPPYCDAARPAPRGHRPLGRGLTGHLVGEALRSGTLDAGADLRTHVRADRLVVDGDGGVIGLAVTETPRALVPTVELAQGLVHYVGSVLHGTGDLVQRLLRRIEQTGQRRFIRARRGVMLCAGGFVFDNELLARHAPAYARCSLRLGTAGDDGTGIRMGAAVGGACGQLHRCSAPRFVDPPTMWWAGVLVGRNGERICNETLYGGKIGEHLVERHDGRGTLLLDRVGMALGRAQLRDPAIHFHQRVFGVVNGYVTPIQAPTLEALARRIGIDARRLRATVDDYNADVCAGRDRHGKAGEHLRPILHPPFFGIPLDCDSLLYPTPCLTLGGLVTDGATSQVLGHDAVPIDGLYAAGRTAVGVASNGYASGLSISDGIFAGRNAARHAAARMRVVQVAVPRETPTEERAWAAKSSSSAR